MEFYKFRVDFPHWKLKPFFPFSMKFETKETHDNNYDSRTAFDVSIES